MVGLLDDVDTLLLCKAADESHQRCIWLNPQALVVEREREKQRERKAIDVVREGKRGGREGGEGRGWDGMEEARPRETNTERGTCQSGAASRPAAPPWRGAIARGLARPLAQESDRRVTGRAARLMCMQSKTLPVPCSHKCAHGSVVYV